MQDEWITIKEASMITGISERTLKWQCRQGRYTTRMVDGNGGAQYRILRQSLSDRVQGAEGSRVQGEIKKAGLGQGILDMRQDGVIKILQGTTSFEELERVVDMERGS